MTWRTTFQRKEVLMEHLFLHWYPYLLGSLSKLDNWVDRRNLPQLNLFYNKSNTIAQSPPKAVPKLFTFPSTTAKSKYATHRLSAPPPLPPCIYISIIFSHHWWSMVEEPLLINSEGEARATFHQGVQGLVHCQVANESFLAVSHATRFSPNQCKTVSKPFFEIKIHLFIHKTTSHDCLFHCHLSQLVILNINPQQIIKPSNFLLC